MLILPAPRDTCYWDTAGTKTFRLSSRKLQKSRLSGFPGWGGNLQNKSDYIRRIYIADPGKCLIQADQSGAEALIVAYLCKPGKFRDLFLNNIKSHSFVATGIFRAYWEGTYKLPASEFIKTPVKKLAANPDFLRLLKIIKGYDKDSPRPYYYIGKKTCHSANYKMGENTFATDVLKESSGKIRLSAREAKQFLAAYHEMFPEIHLWHLEVEQTLTRLKLLRNLQGYPRQFTGVIGNDKTLREAIAFVPQSTVGTITNTALCNLQDMIEKEKLDWDILNNNHDSILLQVPDSDTEKLAGAKTLRAALEQDLMSPRSEPFRMKAEVAVGCNWGKYHEAHNPKGLKAFEWN